MALWLVRAEKHGESEQRFLDENRIYITWHNLKGDLTKATSREDVSKTIQEFYSNHGVSHGEN